MLYAVHLKIYLKLATSNQLLLAPVAWPERLPLLTHNLRPKNLVVSSFRMAVVLYMGNIYFT
jgi:hypothetical protein